MAGETNSFDVVVVGSGPGGACAARGAAEAGLRVVILEREEVPRYKTCGGGILGRAMGLLGERELMVAERGCCRAEFGLGEGLRFGVTREEPVVWMTMRGQFDGWLVEKAVKAGAELRTGWAVRDVFAGREGVRVVTDRGEVRGKIVVAADGAKGVVARKMGWAGYGRVAAALECEVRVGTGDFLRLSGAARFDFDAAPRGYGWVFPKEGHLSMGVLTVARTGVNLKACFERYVERLGIGEVVSVERHGFVIPVMPREGRLGRDGVLLVGDAAGLADPLTGEGISHAILSGQLAGQAIAGAFGRAGMVEERYSVMVEREILGELRWARVLAEFMYMYGMRGVRDAVFRRRGERLAEAMVEVVSGRRGYGEMMGRVGNWWRLLRGD